MFVKNVSEYIKAGGRKYYFPSNNFFSLMFLSRVLSFEF